MLRGLPADRPDLPTPRSGKQKANRSGGGPFASGSSAVKTFAILVKAPLVWQTRPIVQPFDIARSYA